VGLLVLKVSPISNSVGLAYTGENITHKPNATMTSTLLIITNVSLGILKSEQWRITLKNLQQSQKLGR
jgi:hypothetical protein